MSTTTTTPPTAATPPEGWRLAPPGRSVTMGDINAVIRLVAQLADLDVTLPDEITRLTATWQAVEDLRKPDPRPAAGLLADADQLAAMVRGEAQQRAVLAEVGAVIAQVEHEILFDATSWFQHSADVVLDQLRPGFDRAAAEVRAAVDGGVTSTMGLRDAPDDAVALWRAAYGRGAATDQLSAVASARYALSESCWVAPLETGVFNQGDLSVAFNAPAGWWRRTPRLWEQVPAPRLLSVGDAAALRWERRAPVFADAGAEAHHRRLNDSDIDLDVARRASPADLNLGAVAGGFKG